MLQKLSALLVVTTALTPIALNAEQNFFKDKLPSIVKNIAQSFEDGNECVESANIMSFAFTMATEWDFLKPFSILQQPFF